MTPIPEPMTGLARRTAESPGAVGWLRTATSGAALIAVMFGLARYGYGLLLPDMRAELGLSATAAGGISSLAYASYFVANLGVVRVLERWGVRTALTLATACAAVGMSLIALSWGAGALAVGVGLAGAASGFAFPPYAEIVHRRVVASRRDTVWATVSSGTGWGVALAGPVAVLAGEQWRLAWVGFVALTLAAGALAWWAAPVAATARGGAGGLGFATMVRRRGAVPLLLSAWAVGAGSSVWWAFSVDSLRAAEIDAVSARWVFAASGTASLLASFAGLGVRAIGLTWLNRVAAALVVLTLVLFGLTTHHLWIAGATSVVFGVAYTTVIATQGLWSASTFAERPGAGLAAVNAALTVGALSGPAVAGLLIDHGGYAAAFTVAAAAVVPALCVSPPSREPARNTDSARGRKGRRQGLK